MEDEYQNKNDGRAEEKRWALTILRAAWRITKALIGIVLCNNMRSFLDWIMNNILLAPAAKTNPSLVLINLKPYGQVVLYMQVALVCG
jgi:hypothetical protein